MGNQAGRLGYHDVAGTLRRTGAGILFGKLWSVRWLVRLANVYDCCALAVCLCCPVITLLSVCKDVLEIL